MNKLQLCMIAIITFIAVHVANVELLAQDQQKQLLVNHNRTGNILQWDTDRVPLADLLSRLEEKFSVTFLYDHQTVTNKYLSRSQAGLSENPGPDLSRILQELGLAYDEIHEGIFLLMPGQVPLDKASLMQTVSGTVTDAQSGETLPGVNVIVKGTTTGTSTDSEGGFELTVESLQDTLIFSFVGYQTQEVPISGRTEIEVALQSQAIAGEELVVVGYGTQSKSDLTGGVSTVSGEDIADRNTSMVSDALQGASSGLMVTRNSGDPGSGSDIKIRGITTIGNSNPLIIVDGVPRDNIDDINPNNIEDISVLKDAASASIYGVRGAAGVILVSTKRAKRGELSLSSGIEYSYETPTQMPEYVGVTRYLEMANESGWNENQNNDDEYPIYSQDVVNNYHELNAQNPDEYPITDFQDRVMKNSVLKQQYNLDISGGTENVNLLGSLSYENTGGLYHHRNFERINGRLNSDVTIREGLLDAKMDIYFRRDIQQRPSSNPIYFARMSAPIYAAEWSDGRVAGGKNGDNIWGETKYGGTRRGWYNEVGTKLELNYQPLDALELSARVSPSFQFNKNKNFRKEIPYYAADDPTQRLGYLRGYNTTSLSESRSENYKNTSQLLANYSDNFGDHSLSALAGFEEYKSTYESLGASRDEFELTSYPYLNMGPLEFRDNSGSASENAYRSFFGRISYDFKGKYLLQTNMRYDGSSRFHPDYRWGLFPSFSAGWVLTKESFLEGSSLLSFLKLRASYGSLGNERIGNYPYQANLGFNNALFYQGSDVISGTGAAQIGWNIPSITWETTKSYNVGIDINFLDDRLQIVGDVYYKKTEDMLLALEIPDYLGYNNPDQNAGNMFTKGWDFEIKWMDSIGEVEYFVSGNLFDSKTEIGDINGIEFKGSQIIAEGTEYNEWYGYKSDGLFQTQEEVDNSPVTSDAVRPGDVKYIDISGPEGEPDGQISAEYDRVPLGGSLPRYQFGMNVGLDYKNFDFTLILQGVGKRNSHMSRMVVEPLNTYWQNIPKIIDGNYWSHYNSAQENANAEYPRLSEIAKSNNYATSDYWMFDGAYLRVKNINIGYNLPQSLVERVSMQQVKIYANISDVYTFDNYPKGWDPEVASSGYPITTSFSFGATVKF